MNIVEFKEQYPQYRNIPDETLARQLHAKHYSSVDYDTFATKFGVRKTVPQQVKVAKADIEATQRQVMTGAGNKVLPHPLELDLIRHINRGTLTPKDQYVADLQKIRRSPGTTEQKDEAARERTRARFLERVDEIVAVRQNISDRKRWEEEQDKIKGKFLSKTYRRFERGELMVVGGGLFLADTIAKFPTPMSIKRGKPFGGGAVSENINNWSRMMHKALQEPELQPVIENAFDKYFGGAVETGPFLGASIGAAALTGGKSLPASVASFLVAYGVEGNNIYQTALDQGHTERGARIRGTVGGLINGGIEIVGGGGGKYLNAASRKTITKLGKAKYFSRRVLVNALKEGLAEELPQELVGMVLGGDTPTMDDGNVDFIEVAKRLVDAGIMGTILGGAMDVPFSAYGISKLPSIDRGTAVDVGIGRISIPGAVYNEAKIRAEESGGGVNPWIRQSDAEGNKGRTLMVQFNSDLITLEEDPQAKVYYDKLYSKRAGYRRLGDTWEIPKWMGEVNKTVPNADVYFVRDMSEAKEFLATSGYDHIAFSALDVNKENIKELAKDYRGDVSIGGYTDLKFFADLKNVKTYDSIQAMAEDRGHAYVPGTDYSHFEGSQTIPRLCMSKGCKHKCAFCIVPKGVTEMTPEIINNQADEIAKADAQLVYVDDKTFGQAKNHDMLAGMYDRIRSKNPEFEGFIVQTTAAQMQKLDEQMLRDAHVKFIEIGVESYNDAILKANKKPANEKLINEAAAKARRLGIDLIPNIIIGLPQETVETYARTLGWIEDNSDIISHMNIYNLAMYKGSELAESMGDTATLDDLNENKIKKSFHKEPEIHIAAANEFYQLGRSLLDTPLIGDSVPGTVDEAIGEQFGLTPLQTNELLSKAEDRYRLLKNKDVSKRSWQDKRELAFLSRKRGDVEALVGDYTSERPFTRGLWKKPKKPKKKILLRKGHQIPEQMGLTDEQRQNMQEIVTGKRSMAEMTKDEMIQWVNYLEAELAARGERYTLRQPVLPRLIEQLNRATKKEALSSAAIRLKSGEMLTGDTHSNILRDVAASGRTITNEEFDVPAGSGFMTNTGRFVSPEEGWKVGERAGQLRLDGDDKMEQTFIDKKYLVAEGIRYYAPLKSKVANNRITKYIAGKLRSPHQDLVRIERWLEAVDGFGTGLLHDVLWKRVKRADELRSIMTSQGQTAFVNLLEENNNDGALMSGKKETVGDHQLTSMEKIGVYLLAQNKHGFRYLTKGMAFTEEDLSVVSGSLTEQELAIAAWLDEEYRAQWPVLRAAAMDVGVDPEVLEEELNYSPIVRVGDEGDIDFVSLLTEQFNKQSSKPEDGFLQQRRSRALGKLELDAGVIYMKNVQRIETFKAMAPVAKDLGRVLNNPEFKAAFNNATDENGVKILNTWLRDTIKGSIRGPQTWFEKAIAAMRRNGIIYAIGWNVPSAFRQTLSGFNAMAVDPLMMKYHPDNLAKATFTRTGYQDMRDFVVERSTLVRTRKYDRDLRRKWDASRLAKRVEGKKPWDEKAVSWIRWMDEHTVTIAWKSLYDTAMEKTKGDEQAAIEFADQTITRTQPMANMKDLPHFFRGGQIARLLSTFQNQINNNYNFYVHDIIGKRTAGKISNTEAGYRIMMSLVLPAIAFGIIGRGGLPTEDGDISLKKLLIDLTTYPIASVMVVGRWINRMIKGWGKSGTVGEIAPEEAARAYQAMMKGDIRGTIQHAAAAYGAVTGRIPAQAIRTASGTLDLIAGDTRDPRRLVYTQWALDQGNVTKKGAGRIGLGPARGPASRGGPAGGPR
jgi:hypothetical protein